MKEKIFGGVLLLCLILGLSGCSLGSGSTAKELDYREQGIALMDAGEYEKAAEMFQLALDQSYGLLSKVDLDISYYRALALSQSGQIDEAVEVYDSILDLKKKEWNAYYLRGTLLLESGDAEAAINDYNSAVSYDKDDYELYIQIGSNLTAAGYDSQAADYYTQALNISGNDVEDLRYQGYLYYLTGDTDQALSLLSQAAEAGDEEAILYLSQIYLDQEDYATALTYIQQGEAIEDGEYAQQFAFAEVVVYEKQADWTDAKAKIADYVEAYPDDEDGQQEYIFLSSR